MSDKTVQDIKRRRIAAGLSMSELSRQIGASEPYISNLEHGRFRPSAAAIKRINEAISRAPAPPPPKEESPEREAIEATLRAAAAANGQHPRAGAVVLPATLVAYGIENNLSLRQALAMARMVRALAGHVAEDPRASHWRKIHEAIEDLMP
jgi:transcriptional regulator with XRE-family HTH domain